MSERRRPLVVVTGASGGIGRQICLTLARDGFDIIGQYHSRSSEASELSTRLRQSGINCHMVQADLAESSGIRLMVDAIDGFMRSSDSVLRGLVNDAALLLGPGFSTATESEFDRYFAVNLKAPLFLSQRLSERMEEGGSIVNISSAGAHFSSSEDILYAVSKAALESMTVHAAEALAERGIRINAVIPGFTNNGHELFSVPEAREHMSSYSVMGGVSEPAVVAEAVAFLLSERASRTTGSTLDVSGGSTLGARPSFATQTSLRDQALLR